MLSSPRRGLLREVPRHQLSYMWEGHRKRHSLSLSLDAVKTACWLLGIPMGSMQASLDSKHLNAICPRTFAQPSPSAGWEIPIVSASCHVWMDSLSGALDG